MTAVCLDSVGANIESRCHLFVGFALCDKLQDLSLPIRKLVVTIYGSFLLENTDVILRQDAADFWAEKRLIFAKPLG
jgi:hypothetical protein